MAEKFTSLHRNIENTPLNGTIQTKQLPSSNRRPQTSEKARKPPCNWVGQKEKEKEGIRMGPVPRGGICEGGRFSTSWEGASPWEKVHWMEGESSKGLMEGKMGSNLHRGLALPFCIPQLLCWWEWGSGAEAQTPKLSHREKTRVSWGNSLKSSRVRMWQRRVY